MSRRSARDLLGLSYRHARAGAGSLLGTTARKLREQRGKVAVLMYHRVLPDDADISAIEPGMYVRASTFENQLRSLRGTLSIKILGDLVDRPPSAAEAPACAVTFDDGWRDNLSVAWPIMRRLGVRGTVFLVRNWVADGETTDGRFITPEDVRELADAGMEFGAHTTTHPRLDELSPESVEHEMTESRQAVEEWSGRRCRLFAYPFGARDDTATRLAGELFQASVVVGGGWWGPHSKPAEIPRIGIHEDMTSTRAMFFERLAAQV